MSRRSNRASQSQPASQNPRSQTRDISLNQNPTEEQINNCVRYFVNNFGQNAYFRRADIQKNCGVKSGHVFQQTLDKAANILRIVYGYNVLVCDQGTSKGYIVSNALPFKSYSTDENETENTDKRKVLLLLILTHIFMSNVPVSEISLYTFLKHFNIEPDVGDPLFGNVKDYIMNTLIKQKYLQTETDTITKKISFSWGMRAEKEISKHDILKFVSKMYKGRQPKSWTKQFDLANKQEFINERQSEADNMDVD